MAKPKDKTENEELELDETPKKAKKKSGDSKKDSKIEPKKDSKKDSKADSTEVTETETRKSTRARKKSTKYDDSDYKTNSSVKRKHSDLTPEKLPTGNTTPRKSRRSNEMTPPFLKHRQNRMPEQVVFIKGDSKYILLCYTLFLSRLEVLDSVLSCLEVLDSVLSHLEVLDSVLSCLEVLDSILSHSRLNNVNMNFERVIMTSF